MTTKELFEAFIDASAIKDSDKILIQATNTDNNSEEANTAIRLTAALFKAYLTKGLIDVTEDGYLIVNGQQTESNISTPIFRKGNTGIEVSTNNGKTWNTVALYSDISYKQPIVAQTENAVTIFPNVLNVWGVVSRLEIALGASSSVEVSEYMMQFSCGDIPATVILPDDVRWTEEPEFEAGKTYQVSVLNGLAIYAGWNNKKEENV